jgi:hypothetical protein
MAMLRPCWKKESMTWPYHMPKWPIPSNISTANFILDIGILDHMNEEANVPCVIFDVASITGGFSNAITDSNNSIQYKQYCKTKDEPLALIPLVGKLGNFPLKLRLKNPTINIEYYATTKKTQQ